MFDSCKISENMLEDLIMSFGGFCHIARALIYRVANLWPCSLVLIAICLSSPTSIQIALFIVVFSTRGEIGKPARSVSGRIGILDGLQSVRPYFSRSLSIVDSWSACTKPVE
jgi:hypothetical protein